MARTARLYVPLDVNYFDDDRVIAAGIASTIHLHAMTLCKRLLSDGMVTRRQLSRTAPEWITDVPAAIDRLIEVGLFIDRGDSIEVNGWTNWNNSKSDVEMMSRGGKLGAHIKYHVNKSTFGPKCEICKQQKAQGLLTPESEYLDPPYVAHLQPPHVGVSSQVEQVDADALHLQDPGDVDSGLCLTNSEISDAFGDASAELGVGNEPAMDPAHARRTYVGEVRTLLKRPEPDGSWTDAHGNLRFDRA